MTNYGKNERPRDLLPNWFLGGHRKWRVVRALTDGNPEHADGWLAEELMDEVGCGRSTVFEILRGMRPLGLLETSPSGRHRLSADSRLAEALAGLIAALVPFASEEVDRPPRGGRRS